MILSHLKGCLQQNSTEITEILKFKEVRTLTLVCDEEATAAITDTVTSRAARRELKSSGLQCSHHSLVSSQKF